MLAKSLRGAVGASGCGWRRGGARALSSFQLGSDGTIQLDLAGLGAGPQTGSRIHEGFDFDVLVIGGGSGGLACSREAAALGARAAVLDLVTPSTQGTTWGLGGTCVNVGCIPKKLMHTAGSLGTALQDATEMGWQVPRDCSHDWPALVENVQNYIKGTNFGYVTALRSEEVAYYNALGRITGPNRVVATDANGGEQELTAKHIVLAVGGRPTVPDSIPGARELCITSDDIFSLPTSPGRTLVVGGSYVALETAGFLTDLGHPATVMIRSSPLRGFDQQMASHVVGYMERHGTRMLRGRVPLQVEAVGPGGGVKRVTHAPSGGGSGEAETEDFDTVILATGRTPSTASLGCDAVGVALDGAGFIEADESDQAAEDVFAIGDAVRGRPQLTPTAIEAGRRLARRLYRSSGPRPLMGYSAVPTTVFTPLEYASVGEAEEAAEARLGADNIEVYHLAYDTLEMAAAHRTTATGEPDSAACYSKVVCEREGAQRVLGIHIAGPGAGDILQGFAVAFRQGLTKEALDDAVGIHPTHAEELVALDRTKRSGRDFVKTSC